MWVKLTSNGNAYASPLADLSQVWPEANQHFSKEIDDEANSYFQRIYNHPPHPTMSVDEVRSLLPADLYLLSPKPVTLVEECLSNACALA